MADKYGPLEDYLRGIPNSQIDLTLMFEQIEQILNDKLPPSAYQHRAWWGNEKQGSHVEAQAWLKAGWKMETVNFKEKWVRFIRDHN